VHAVEAHYCGQDLQHHKQKHERFTS
jgi:hypothetical protein